MKLLRKAKMLDYNLWFKEEFPILQENGLWSILPDTAYFLFQSVLEKKPKHILEYGSGISTAVMAKAISQYGGKVYSLEHELKWLEKTQKDCQDCGVENYEVLYAPLVKSGLDGIAKYTIYDPAKIPPNKFEFVFIDGPPGFLPEHPGRRGTLYSCWAYLADQATIILDDADRKGEQEAMKEWLEVFGKKLKIKNIQLMRGMVEMEVRQH